MTKTPHNKAAARQAGQRVPTGAFGPVDLRVPTTRVLASEPPALPTGELPSGKPQEIVINGVAMVMMPKSDYDVLIEAARDNIEDLADAADAIDILKRIESGEEETFPAEMVNRLTHADETGDSRIKIVREHRGMTQADLAEAIGSNRLYVSQLETGVRGGSVDILQKIAAALGVSIDLVMPKAPVVSDTMTATDFAKNLGISPARAALLIEEMKIQLRANGDPIATLAKSLGIGRGDAVKRYWAFAAPLLNVRPYGGRKV